MDNVEKVICCDRGNDALAYAAMANNKGNDPMALAAMMNGGLGGAQTNGLTIRFCTLFSLPCLAAMASGLGTTAMVCKMPRYKAKFSRCARRWLTTTTQTC